MFKLCGLRALVLFFRRVLPAFVLVVAAAGDCRAASLIGPVPDWVKPVELSTQRPVVVEGQGVQYLLIDRQVRATGVSVSSYRHLAMRVTHEDQLTDESQIEVTFDPSYQRLSFHHVRLLRDGAVLDRLRPQSIQLLQRERDLEALILDGRKSAHLVLDDVRVGDVIEYDYTLEGSNPALADSRYGRVDLQYAVPVEQIHFRLLWPDARELAVRRFNGADAGTVASTRDGVREIVWQGSKVPALKVENDAPGWYDPLAYVEWGDARSWRDVAQWALPLYRVPADLGPELRRERDAVLKAGETPEERVAAALRLVQGQVRYLGIEMGPGSYTPRAPELVFRRRFGDCKDKALLLVALLRGAGIEAEPALVNTRSKQELEKALPSPVQFDHVIVHVQLGSREYWLDPTRSTQFGELGSISQSDYRRALLVAPGTQGLTTMARPDPQLNRRQVQVSIDGSSSRDKPALMTVRSHYFGQAAERMRADLASQSREQLQKLYLNFYADYYPGLTVAEPLAVSDDHQRNEVQTTESYSIPELWHHPREGKRLQASLFSGELQEFLKKSNQSRRQSPLYLAYPLDFEVSSEMKLPREWGGSPDKTQIDGPGFKYRSEVKWPTPDRVVTTARYQSLSDEVAAADVPGYNDKIGRARDDLGYTLYDVGAPAGFAERINWPVLMVALALLAGLSRLAWQLFRWDPEPAASALADDGLSGLGGWLIFLGFGLLLRLWRQLHAGFEALPAYALQAWNGLTTPGSASYHALWAPALFIELLLMIFMVVASVLMLLLFFRKRSSFPRLMTGFLWAGLLVAVADDSLLQLLPIDKEPLAKVIGGWVGAAAVCALWTAYLRRSKRVANTFVARHRSPPAVVPAGLPEAQ